MVKVTFQINGKEYSAERATDAIAGASFALVAAAVQEKIGNTRCAAHGESPRVNVVGTSLKDLKFEVSGCCEGLESLVTKAFAEES